MGIGLGVVASSLLLAGAPAAGGEPASESSEARMSVAWSAPPECPDRDELLARLTALLGREPNQPDDPQLEGEGNIVASVGGYALRLELRAPSEYVRELESPRCEDLTDAAALILAMTIDPLGPLDPADELEPDEADSTLVVEEPASTDEPLPPDQPAPAEQQPTPAERERGPLVALRLGAIGSFGPLPGFSGGPQLALAVGARAGRSDAKPRASVRVELSGSYLVPRVATADQADAGVRVSLGQVGLRGCGVPELGAVSLPFCVGVQAGVMHGRGFGADLGDSARATALPWAAAEFGVAVAYALTPRIAPWLGVDGAVPLVRPGFEVRDLGVVHRAASAGVQVMLGVELRFETKKRRSYDVHLGQTDPSASGQGGGR